MKTFGEYARQPAPRSFWRERLRRRTAEASVEDYLVDEANLRGYWGAWRRDAVERPIDDGLRLEDIAVGLVAPQAAAEVRHLKLVLRILQSGKVDPRLLWLRAKRELAVDALRWLLENVPASERSDTLRTLLAAAPPPRAARPPRLDYDFGRLVRRPATAQDLWTRARRKS